MGYAPTRERTCDVGSVVEHTLAMVKKPSRDEPASPRRRLRGPRRGPPAPALAARAAIVEAGDRIVDRYTCPLSPMTTFECVELGRYGPTPGARAPAPVPAPATPPGTRLRPPTPTPTPPPCRRCGNASFGWRTKLGYFVAALPNCSLCSPPRRMATWRVSYSSKYRWKGSHTRKQQHQASDRVLEERRGDGDGAGRDGRE
jgi:hypothetical protein